MSSLNEISTDQLIRVKGDTSPHPFLQQASRQVLKDDVNGFPSTSGIYFISSRITWRYEVRYMISVLKAHGWLLFLIHRSLNNE